MNGWVITLCWDCSMASKYLIIWLLKSLAFCFCKKQQGCRHVSMLSCQSHEIENKTINRRTAAGGVFQQVWGTVWSLLTPDARLNITRHGWWSICSIFWINSTCPSGQEATESLWTQIAEALLFPFQLYKYNMGVKKSLSFMTCFLSLLKRKMCCWLFETCSDYLWRISWSPWLESHAPCQKHQ